MRESAFILWRPSDSRHYLPLVALVVILAALVTLLYFVFSVIRVDGGSMLPALEHNDRILVTRGYSTPERGDVVAFFAVERDGSRVRLLKRVVAVPGDSVEIVGDSAYVNGELSLVAPTATVSPDGWRSGPITVPEGTVFVLGDNRPESLDSRIFGPVPLSSVIGRATAIVLPLSRSTMID
jgi:signal peptidase I